MVAKIYGCTRGFPADERFGLTSQLRRAAVSVVANIAEGTGRVTKGEFVNSVSVARGSAMEVNALCGIARDLGFLSDQDCFEMVRDADEVSRMLHALQRRNRWTR